MADFNDTVYIEYLAVEFLLDTEVTSWYPMSVCQLGQICTASHTSQEFLFREYLQSGAVEGLSAPDLILFFGNSHDKIRMTLQDFSRSLR